MLIPFTNTFVVFSLNYFMSSLARQCAQLWVKTRESLGHPLGLSHETNHLLCSKEILHGETRKVLHSLFGIVSLTVRKNIMKLYL